jgi:hypothetical protein
MISSSEVQAMIDSVRGGKITPRERAELLTVIERFGSSVPRSERRLAAKDERAIKKLVLSGIETLADFNKQSARDRVNFLIHGTIFEDAGPIGFVDDPVSRASLPKKVNRLIGTIVKANRRDAARNPKYARLFHVRIAAISRNGEPYGYTIDVSMPTRTRSGFITFTSVVAADASYYRQVFTDFEFNEPEPESPDDFPQ